MRWHIAIVLYMINRELIRIKAVQLVYANLVNGGKDLEDAVKEMEESLTEAYSMYHHMLNLICEITDYAAQQYEITCAQLLDRGRRELPNDRFINNRFAMQLENNRKLETFMLDHKDLRWTYHEDVVHAIYDMIVESPEYELYMESETDSYEADREFWRTAYTLTLNEQRTSLLLHEVEDYVPAGTAVVLISEQNATATLTLASEYDNEDALPTALTGTYTAQVIPAGAESSNYFLGKLNDVPGFYRYGGETLSLAANRAYLKMDSEVAPANGFSLTLSDDDITAIIDAVSSANGAPHYYDLQGRRVAAPQKGRIYIVNGKKTIF